MVRVVVEKGESIDEALKRFKRQVNKDEILKEVRKREFYLKPGVRKREERKESRKKHH